MTQFDQSGEIAEVEEAAASHDVDRTMAVEQF